MQPLRLAEGAEAATATTSSPPPIMWPKVILLVYLYFLINEKYD